MMKMTFLIVGILSVPMAYYFWMGGWDAIPGAPPPELTSFNSKSIIPPPSLSTEEERGGDPGIAEKGKPRTAKSLAGEPVAILEGGTPGVEDTSSTAARAPNLSSPPDVATNDLRATAKTEPRRPKSSAGETIVMLQPPTPSAQASSPAVRALDAEQINLLIKQGEQFMAAGDVVTARIAFQRAAEAGDAKAALALGATYDPSVLAKVGVVGINADAAKARSWYEKAEKLGSPEGKRRLELLADR
jgi:hypothetical protein